MFLLKVICAALVISFCSWLSGKKPELAGFIVALPLVSIIALLFSYFEHKDSEISISFAKSIMLGVPISWLFFIPFFFAHKFNYGFVGCYIIGIALLIIGFFIHKYISGL
ncbi:MAG: hypothetical protein VX185_13345 [Pseudomonadota bacterium]|nr:hypothetical protein [Pseudomonadota bacterium]